MHVGQGLQVADVPQDLLLGDELVSQVADENFGLFAESSPEMQKRSQPQKQSTGPARGEMEKVKPPRAELLEGKISRRLSRGVLKVSSK